MRVFYQFKVPTPSNLPMRQCLWWCSVNSRINNSVDYRFAFAWVSAALLLLLQVVLLLWLLWQRLFLASLRLFENWLTSNELQRRPVLRTVLAHMVLQLQGHKCIPVNLLPILHPKHCHFIKLHGPHPQLTQHPPRVPLQNMHISTQLLPRNRPQHVRLVECWWQNLKLHSSICI